jgi:DNA-binding MarR family transcriptional regulator
MMGGVTPRPPRSPDPTLGELFVTVTRGLHRQARDALSGLGLTPASARALRVLGGADRPLRMSELAERLRIVPRSATTLVDALEGDGLVQRQPDEADRRSMRVHLTPAGAQLLTRMRQARYGAADRLLAALPDDDRDALRRVLLTLDASLDQYSSASADTSPSSRSG